MALRNTVREPGVFEAVQLNANLHQGVWNMVVAPQITTAPTSVLLRTVALVALTHREHQNAIADPVVVTPEILKLFPINDCLFPFSNRGVVFANQNVIDSNVGRLDLIIANNELNPDNIAGARPTALNFIRFLNNPAGIVPAPAWAIAAEVVGGNIPGIVPDFANELNPAIIFADLNDSILRSQTNPRVPAPNLDMADLNFFDEVNAVHNVHKELTRNNINTIRNRTMVANKTIVTSVPNSRAATTIAITNRGNFGATLVSSWGAYDGLVREANAFKRLMWTFNPVLGQEQANNNSVIQDAIILKDLYRLECIREPAALITNAMFLELATSNHNAGYRGFGFQYNFANIETKMPMALTGAVDSSRSLWKKIIWGRRENMPIYYRYDYASGGDNINDLTTLENNLLFNYITWKAGIPDLHNTVAGGNNIFDIKVNQRDLLVANGFAVNANIYTKTVNLGIFPNPDNRPDITAMNDRYAINANKEIIITATFQNDTAILELEDIKITKFPLELINQLLFKWYMVDVGLPDVAIDFGLQIKIKDK